MLIDEADPGRQVGRDERLTAGHRFGEHDSEGFRVRGAREHHGAARMEIPEQFVVVVDGTPQENAVL